MKALLASLLFALPLLASAQQLPRVAVADLAYEEQVSRHFQYSRSKGKVQHKESERFSESESRSSGSSSSSGKAEAESESFSTQIMIIERGELRKFTADIKGQMLKSGAYKLVQAKPYTSKDTAKLFDVIDRIKQGYFPNADYVLFGAINSVEPRREMNPVQGSNATSASLSMELVVEFSLIDTKTHEIKAAFTAMGEGNDMRLVNDPNQVVHLSKSKVMREVSQTLGEDVAGQLEDQLGNSGTKRSANGRYREDAPPARATEPVTNYR